MFGWLTNNRARQAFEEARSYARNPNPWPALPPDPGPDPGTPWQGLPPPIRGNNGAPLPLPNMALDVAPDPVPTQLEVPSVEVLEGLSLEQLLQLRSRLNEVITPKLAAMGMQLKDTAKITFAPATDSFWEELRLALESLGCQPRKAQIVVAEVKKSGRKFLSIQEAIATAVMIMQKR